MILFEHHKDLQKWLDSHAQSLAFVPTMGALHKGHCELIKHAQSLANTCLVSIYVNPLQFNDAKDLTTYPRPLTSDLHILKELGVHGVYAPTDEDPFTHSPQVSVRCHKLAEELCGKYRPGHFHGVCTIVSKLLGLIRPDYLVMGEKDFQQCLIIKAMIQEFFLPVTLVTYPTVRDEQGRALSSRLQRLSATGKELASYIFPALQACKHLATENSITRDMLTRCFQNHFPKDILIEYLSINCSHSLETIPVFDPSSQKKAGVFVCVVIEGVRLVDHIMLESYTPPISLSRS